MAQHEVRMFDDEKDTRLVHQFVQIHRDCIEQDSYMGGFIPPLDSSKMLAYWQTYVDDVKAGTRLVIIQTLSHSPGVEEVTGLVSLYMPRIETGPFRSEVHKLLVSPKHRYKGIAKVLMLNLEQVAKERDRWLVMVDTTIGSGVEHVYPKLGYKKVGVVPNYGISPKDGTFRDEIFFYKDLRDADTITNSKMP